MRVCLADKKIRIKYTYAPITTDRGIRIFFGGEDRGNHRRAVFPGTRDFEVTGSWRSEEKEKNHKEGDKDVSPQ